MEAQATYQRRNGNKATNDLSGFVFGKAMPSALSLEEAVLGAVMIERDAIGVVADLLKPDSFYSASHRAIFEACMSLFTAGAPIDILTVTNQLHKSGQLDAIGGASMLVGLTNRVGSGANVEYHARIIQQAAIKRRVIEISNQAINDAYDPANDPFDLLAKTEQQFFGITNFSGKEGVTLADAGADVLLQLAKAMERPDGLTGVDTGFAAVNAATGGLQNADLIILAARPGMGKTAFAMNLALNAAKVGTPVGVFSLEMPAAQLVQRLASAESGIPGESIRMGKVYADDLRILDETVRGFSGIPLHIDDSAGLRITELRAKARRMHQRHGIGLLVVDYLQLLGSDNKQGQNREQEVSGMSRGLKALAKELNIPIVALSQLSRNCESRADKRPLLSDLRESGAIEQDADIVAFIYRDEYYDIQQDHDGNNTKGRAELIFAKNRNGGPKTILMGFNGPRVMFHDLNEQPQSTSTQFPAAAAPMPVSREESNYVPF